MTAVWSKLLLSLLHRMLGRGRAPHTRHSTVLFSPATTALSLSTISTTSGATANYKVLHIFLARLCVAVKGLLTDFWLDRVAA